MATFRVLINNFSANYTEKWEANSPQEAEQKARERWQREFKDAGAFRFHASPDRRDSRYSDDEDE
jgi:hypothetical protein